MRFLVYLTFTFSFLIASSINIVKFRDEGKDVYHLVLKSQDLFRCKIDRDFTLKDKIICDIKNTNGINEDKTFELFNLKIENNKVIVSPKSSYRFFVDDKEIYDKKVFSRLVTYKKVDFLFYKTALSFLNNKDKDVGLDFDIKFNNQNDLFINVLNDDLKPVVSLKDVTKLNFIKKLYKKGDFVSVIKKADSELENDNIYSSEILLYKIKALDRLLEDKNEREFHFIDIINACNDFAERFPSNKHLTEVLFYKIKSLYPIGKYKKANSIVNVLENNFEKDFYTEKAKILKAKSIFNRKKSKRYSYKILKDVLFGTKHDKNALESAYSLVENYLVDKDAKNARKFLDKILSYSKDYLLKDKKLSYRYAKTFADLKDYDSAVKIAQILKNKYEDEELYKNLPFWQEKANMKDLAYKNYKVYLKKYTNGRFVEFVKERMDKVLLDIKDSNSSKKLKDIDNIIKKYKDEPIYKKALIEKVKLFYKEGKYQNILDLSDELKDINKTKYIDMSAQKLVYAFLKKDDCIKAVNIVQQYKVSIISQRLYDLTKCYYKLARYKESLDLCQKFIQSSSFDTSHDAIKWYRLAIFSASKKRDWPKAIKLYEDLLKFHDKDSIKVELLFEVFDSYFGLKYIDKALTIVSDIQKKEADNPKLLDVYYKLIKYYKDKNMDLSVVMYGKKLLALEKKLKVQTYSPLIDIWVIKSLKNLNRYKEALSYFANAYLSKNINDTQKAQLLYLAGELSLKVKNIKQAREFFIKCGTDVKNDNWQKLCSESLKLLEDK